MQIQNFYNYALYEVVINVRWIKVFRKCDIFVIFVFFGSFSWFWQIFFTPGPGGQNDTDPHHWLIFIKISINWRFCILTYKKVFQFGKKRSLNFKKIFQKSILFEGVAQERNSKILSIEVPTIRKLNYEVLLTELNLLFH